MEELAAEMMAFQYIALKGGGYRFEAGTGHDDRVYSLAWAIYSLRREVIDGIQNQFILSTNYNPEVSKVAQGVQAGEFEIHGFKGET